MTEIATLIIARLRDALPTVTVTDRGAAYAQGGPGAGMVTVAVDMNATGEARLLAIGVDIDVWMDGPDGAAADDLASEVESILHQWSVNTARQGTVRLRAGSRAPVTDSNEKLAHVSLRLMGRGLRRFSNA